ncbi:efflux RND transporter periplasmic adaptor subunit [Sphingobium ummariense]
MRRSMVWTALSLAALIAILFAWRVVHNTPPLPPPMPPTEVTAITVKPRQVLDELRAVGSLSAMRQVLLAAETPGRVTAIRFAAGDHVSQGTALLTLFDTPERSDLAAAHAKADFARIQLQRSKELAPSGAEPRELLQQRQAEYDQAVAAVAQVQARLVQKQVRAPFSGEIGIRRVNLGQYLNAGDGIATLTDLDRLYADFTVPQSELAKLQLGGPVLISADNQPGRTFSARITAIEPVVGSDTRNVIVQATLPNADHALRPGMYVTAHVQLAARKAIVVPTTAIQTSASGDTVIVVRAPDRAGQGKADIVPVKLGARIRDDVVVTEGLRPGDVVVTVGQLRILPGAAVRISRPSATQR